MKNPVILIENIKKEDNQENIKSLVLRYINNGYSINTLLEMVKDFKGDKRNLILGLLADTTISNLDKISESKCLEDADKVYVIKKLINDDKHISVLAYDIMLHIDNPKKYLNNDEIKWILKDVGIKEVIDKYGAYFSLELLDKLDYFYLLNIKNELPDEVLNQIYFKAFRSEFEYINFVTQISDEDKKNCAKMFLKLNCTNYKIAFNMIRNKAYQEEDYAGLLKVIENYASADIIYKVLMNEKVDEKEEQALEKALLKTGNIEYISYYYFYKNREKFILLFGSTLLFLSFVMINEDKFKNKELLNIITETITKEERSFSQVVNSKVGIAYHKMPKINSKK